MKRMVAFTESSSNQSYVEPSPYAWLRTRAPVPTTYAPACDPLYPFQEILENRTSRARGMTDNCAEVPGRKCLICIEIWQVELESCVWRVSFHKYVYVHGDPIQGIDPTGMFFSVGGMMASTSISSSLGSMNAQVQFGIHSLFSGAYGRSLEGEDFFVALEDEFNQGAVSMVISAIPGIGPLWDMIQLAGATYKYVAGKVASYFGPHNAVGMIAESGATGGDAMAGAAMMAAARPLGRALLRTPWKSLEYVDKIAKRRIGARFGRQLAGRADLSADVVPYRNAPSGSGAQANHLNQSALFPNISRNDGLTVQHPGVASRDIGTAHYEFHRTMELWQDQFRPNGPRYRDKPTVAEYNEALKRSLFDAGHNRQQVDLIMNQAVREQLSNGYFAISQLNVPERGVYTGLKELF